jgi:hypothetical protein
MKKLLSLWLNNQSSRSKTEATVLLRIALAITLDPDLKKIDLHNMSHFEASRNTK